MGQIDIKQIEELLREQYDYPTVEIKKTAEEICKMSEHGKQIFRSFVETGILPDVSSHGLSIREMQKELITHEHTVVFFFL